MSGCVRPGSTSVHVLSRLLAHVVHVARCLATLKQGKFGQLKINLVFAEKNVKLKNGERRIKQTTM